MADASTISPAAALTSRERAQFDQLEAKIHQGRKLFCAVADAQETIKRGRGTFEAVMTALLTIHERRLWRERHPSFKTYITRRWGFSRSRAYQILDAAKLARQCKEQGIEPPKNESQARALIRGAAAVASRSAPAAERKSTSADDRTFAKRVSDQRAGLAVGAKVAKLLAELRVIHAEHPYRAKADELLGLYESLLLPWPPVPCGPGASAV